MDESFLSDAKLIEASQDFVCIRLATFENAEEAEFLKGIYRSRSGELENTVFALMDPDASKVIGRAGRSPQIFYRRPADMAKAMDEIAKAHPGNDSTLEKLPQMSDFRLALNVASCDGVPLVAALSTDKAQGIAFEKMLAAVAFSELLAGKFHFVTTDSVDDFQVLKDGPNEAGVYVVTPGSYGVDGAVTESFSSDVTDAELISRLQEISDRHAKIWKNHRRHVKGAAQQKIEWETKIPVTDPDSLNAMKR